MTRRAEAIAVIGAAGRFPGAENLDKYWQLLLKGEVVSAAPPADRQELWRIMDDPLLASKVTTLNAGYLDDVAGFDADYFSISPREAVKLDPQQRLMLEVSYKALENAGFTREALRGAAIGVFIGAGSTDYSAIDSFRKANIDGYHGLGNSHSILANRISYYFNFKGPSLTIDTACSSSLTALHFAIQSLCSGEIDTAIVGGVNVIVSPDLTLAFSQAKMLSPTGRCKTFSATADGYGRAEGAGAIVIKRLQAAQQQGDAIRCVIQSTAINQDGRSNGITAPNGQSQIAVIQTAIRRAGLQVQNLGYFEAHGTGTPLGDAIEFNALKTVLNESDEARCYVGSAKANVGHAEAAAGIFGLLKAILMLEHQLIPPHPIRPPYNKLIADNRGNLSICEQISPLDPARGHIGVSSFGFGGSNAHAILTASECRAGQQRQVNGRCYLIPLSSHFPQGLAKHSTDITEFLKESSNSLDEIAYSAGVHRDHYAFRTAWVAENREHLQQQVLNSTQHREFGGSMSTIKIAFVFSGQGSQYKSMGKALYHRFSAFRQAFDRCDQLIQQCAGFAIAARLYSGDDTGSSDNDDNALLENTYIGQMCLFCFEYALAQLWLALGVRPDYIIGHSLGELVGHAVAETFPLDAAVKLVNERAKLMQREQHRGGMLAVFAETEQVAGYVRELALPLAVAAINGDRNVVLSGDRRHVDKLQAHLAENGTNHALLPTRHAFHSPFFSRAAKRLDEYAAGVKTNAPKIPVVSNLDGSLLLTDELRENYWGQHIVSPVQFAKGVERLVTEGVCLFLEIGPKRILSPIISRDFARQDVHALASIQSERNAERSFLLAVAKLYEMGMDIRFASLFNQPLRKINLPARSLNHKPYWTNGAAVGQSLTTAKEMASVSDVHPVSPPEESVGCSLTLINRQIENMKSQLILLADEQ